jgi:hypothetical protein
MDGPDSRSLISDLVRWTIAESGIPYKRDEVDALVARDVGRLDRVAQLPEHVGQELL